MAHGKVRKNVAIILCQTIVDGKEKFTGYHSKVYFLHTYGRPMLLKLRTTVPTCQKLIVAGVFLPKLIVHICIPFID